MGGTCRRVARSRGDGGPSAGLVAVKRRSVGGEPTRRRAWTGESSTDAASVENLGDMVSSWVGNGVRGGADWPWGGGEGRGGREGGRSDHDHRVRRSACAVAMHWRRRPSLQL